MDKTQAIQEFKKLREKTGVSRDKAIEIYNQFKHNKGLFRVSIPIGGVMANFERTEMWDVINTKDIRNIYSRNNMSFYELERLQECNTRVRKEKLRITDKLNYERKAFDKDLRQINRLEELNEEFINKLQDLKPQIDIEPRLQIEEKSDATLLVQLSDLHINELTNMFRENYDITIASKRLKKFANRIKQEITQKGITKCVIFMTGDMCNSDSLLSKRMNSTSNKAISVLIATKLIEYFILDIYQVCQNITIGSVAGNEGRLDNLLDFYPDENLITNSPDFMIVNMLKYLLEDFYTITFLQGRNAEQIVNINGSNILFLHGVQYGKGDMGKSVAQTFARYSDKGINIRFSVSGHLHSSKISNYFMRSSSLVGDNAYGSNQLNLSSRASQNIAFIHPNGEINAMSIDLQDVNNIKGYDLTQEIKQFDIKSSSKKEFDDEVYYV